MTQSTFAFSVYLVTSSIATMSSRPTFFFFLFPFAASILTRAFSLALYIVQQFQLQLSFGFSNYILAWEISVCSTSVLHPLLCLLCIFVCLSLVRRITFSQGGLMVHFLIESQTHLDLLCIGMESCALRRLCIKTNSLSFKQIST